MADEQNHIPKSKIQRASRFMRTGAKVGGNYVKHYSKKLVNPSLSRDTLDEQNAKDIYDALSELKGSALKAAQMLSMDRSVMPAAYAKQFIQAQYQAPPLSGPLIVKTFKEYFGQSPSELFDSFDIKARQAASIGQVHRAEKDGQPLAVKIQYPGVGDSVVSDLNLVRPVARRLFGWKDRDLDAYFEEVKTRLVEETDYALELRRSIEISQACAELPNLVFATYYPDYSADRIITMSWLEGKHLDDFLATNPTQATCNQIGQALWDFYNYQLHTLKVMHADAHPGNFLFRADGTVAVLDFGCVKEIPDAFYQNYFALLQPSTLKDPVQLRKSLIAAQIIFSDDTPEDQAMYTNIAIEAMSMVLRPFHQGTFDFGDETYFDEIYAYGDRMGHDPALRESKVPRGDADGLYMNRTYFGLFSILNKLKAEVETTRFMPVLS
jgi:predicted unusual protein kinase regulating ubiquinone biosynthesis (AarF/ABC1/UbiB family)